MDQKTHYGHPFSGFQRLGYLKDLEAQDTWMELALDPVLDSKGKQSLLKKNGLDKILDMFVLYVWTDVSSNDRDMFVLYIWTNVSSNYQGTARIIYRIIPHHLQWQ